MHPRIIKCVELQKIDKFQQKLVDFPFFVAHRQKRQVLHDLIATVRRIAADTDFGKPPQKLRSFLRRILCSAIKGTLTKNALRARIILYEYAVKRKLPGNQFGRKTAIICCFGAFDPWGSVARIRPYFTTENEVAI